MNLKSWFGGRQDSRDNTEAILGRYLDGDFVAFPMAEVRAFPTQIEQVESQYRVRYPPGFSAHVCGRFPGVYVEVKEAIWPRPTAFAVGPFWSFLYAFHTYTSVPDSEPWMRLDAAAADFQAQTGLKAAPILRIVGDADLYCTSPTGSIVRFRHETAELEPVKMGFWELFEEEVRALRERKDMKRAEV